MLSVGAYNIRKCIFIIYVCTIFVIKIKINKKNKNNMKRKQLFNNS